MTQPTTQDLFRQSIRTELEKNFNEMESEISIFLNGCFIEQVIRPSSFEQMIRIQTITGMEKSFPLYASDISNGTLHNKKVDILKFAKEEFINYSLT